MFSTFTVNNLIVYNFSANNVSIDNESYLGMQYINTCNLKQRSANIF